MVLFRVTLVSLAEELREVDPTIISSFYADDAALDGLEQWSVAQLKLLMDWGSDRGYFLEPAKSIFIADNPEEKEATKREFEQEGLNINYAYGSRYLGGLFGAQGGARGVGAAKG